MTSPVHALDTVVFARGLRVYGDNGGPVLNFEVFPGDIFVIVGPAGAGKTALIEILAGVRRTSADELQVCGTAPGRRRASRPRSVGAALHNVAFERGLTVEEAVTLFATFQGDDRMVASTLELMGLGARRRERVDTLPRPASQRLLLSVALMHDPLLFLADDPGRDLDLEGSRLLWNLLRRRRERGLTSVFTTTRLEEAEHLADRIAVLNAGYLIAVDTPERLIGASTGLARITFDLAQSTLDEGSLRRLDGVLDMRLQDGRYTVRCGDAFRTIRSLVRFLDDRNASPTALTVRHPTLEDTVVELTARSVSAVRSL